MKRINTSLDGVFLIECVKFGDERGYFSELYREDTLKSLGIVHPFVQDNESVSCQGTLRGLHYQRDPHAQAKLVRVLEGSIYDVAVDLRPHSNQFGQWVGVHLDAQHPTWLYIPEGFAHGFYVTSPMAKINYKCSALYAPQAEGAIVWNDPTLAIDWPISTGPLVSAKDQVADRFLSFKSKVQS